MERFPGIKLTFDRLGTHMRETADMIAFHAHNLSHTRLNLPDVRGGKHLVNRKIIDMVGAQDFEDTHPHLQKKFDIGPLCLKYLKGPGDMHIATIVQALQNGFSLGEIEYNLSLSERFITKVEEFRQISPDLASTHIYNVMLQRTPDVQEKQEARTFGGITADMITNIRKSDEFGLKLIKSTYTHSLARNATDEELEGHKKALHQGFALTDLLRDIRTNREAKSLTNQKDQKFRYFISPLLEEKAPMPNRQDVSKSANRLPFIGYKLGK